MTEDTNINAAEPIRPAAERRRHRSALFIAGVAGAAMLVVGVAAGAGASRLMHRGEAQTLLPPTAINTLDDGNVVAFKGAVAEIYGNKFIVQDPSGRALVETGRDGEGGKLVAKDETVIVQGRYDDGFVKGSVIIHADGRTQTIGPAGGPPPHKMKDWLRRP